MAQNLRPDADITTDWTTAPLWSKIDEVSADDLDFISSSTSGHVAEVTLTNGTDPSSSTGHIIYWRRRGTATSLVVTLYQGATLIATAPTDTGPGAVYADTSYTLSGGEADAITDYADLRIRFTLGAAVNTRVSQSLFEIPDAAAAGANVNLLAGKLGMKLVGKL